MVDLEREIRVRLEAVVQGLPLHQFEDWFVPLLGADYQAEESIQNLLSEIHIALAEYSSGDLSLEDLKVRLRMLAKDEKMETKSKIDSAPDRQEQLADLMRRAASQPGLNAVMELSRQEWFRLASLGEPQLPTIERFGIGTDTATALI